MQELGAAGRGTEHLHESCREKQGTGALQPAEGADLTTCACDKLMVVYSIMDTAELPRGRCEAN